MAWRSRSVLGRACLVLLASCSHSTVSSSVDVPRKRPAVAASTSPSVSTSVTGQPPASTSTLPAPTAPAVQSAVEQISASAGPLSGPVARCLGEKLQREPADVAELAAGSARVKAVATSAVRACERVLVVSEQMVPPAGKTLDRDCVARVLSSSTDAETEEFQSRLLDPSRGDPGKTPLGRELLSCS
jgi:hypothetical protein